MRIPEGQLQVLAKAIVDELIRADAIELPGSHEAAEKQVRAELEEYFGKASDLERDAERIADERLKAAGREGLGLDRRIIVQKIKEKLGEERGFPA